MEASQAIQQSAVNPAQGSLPPGTEFIITQALGTPVPAAPTAGAPGEGAPVEAAQAPGGPAGTPEVPTQPPTPVGLPEPPVEPVTPNPDTTQQFVYEPTGDAGLDYALKFVGDLGYGDTHPAIIAAQQGNFALIKAELATKGVPGSEAVVSLAVQAYKAYAEKEAEKAKALQSFAYQAAGGEDNWSVVQAWAAANATDEEKAQVNAAIQQGGFAAEAVIRQLVALYQQQHTLAKSPAQVAQPGTGVPAPSQGPMTAKAYSEAVENLYRQYGDRVTDTPEYRNLQAQRLAARQAGY
mgnify:CR=1 FL=1